MAVSNGIFLLLTMSGPCGIRSSAVKKLKPMFWPGDQRKMEFLGFVLGHDNFLATDSTVQLGLLALISDTPSTPSGTLYPPIFIHLPIYSIHLSLIHSFIFPSPLRYPSSATLCILYASVLHPFILPSTTINELHLAHGWSFTSPCCIKKSQGFPTTSWQHSATTSKHLLQVRESDNLVQT